MWLAHTAFGLPLAVYLLRNYIGALHPRSSSRRVWTGPTTSTIFWPRRPPFCPGARRVRHLPVPLGVERLADRLHLPRGDERYESSIALSNLVGARGEGGSCSPRRPSSRWPCPCWCSSRSSGTSSAGSRQGRSRDERRGTTPIDRGGRHGAVVAAAGSGPSPRRPCCWSPPSGCCWRASSPARPAPGGPARLRRWRSGWRWSRSCSSSLRSCPSTPASLAPSCGRWGRPSSSGPSCPAWWAMPSPASSPAWARGCGRPAYGRQHLPRPGVGRGVRGGYGLPGRVTGAMVLFPAPIFPFTALGIADHLAERRAERTARSASSA